METDLLSVFEDLARAKANLAYAKAKRIGTFASALHSNKYLYFMRCGDAIKIGVSSSPEDRARELQTGAPGKVEFVAIIARAGGRESECHKRLSHLHLYGEWFRYTDEVDALIKWLQDTMR